MSNQIQALLDRVAKIDPATAAELRRHIDALIKRREYGLNFEKHVPERVHLVGRPITVGDMVCFIPPRGQIVVESKDAWIVESITGRGARRVAELHHADTGEKATRAIDDLVYAADFRDPIYPGLKSTGKVERGGDKPFHTVINAENYHSLEALMFAHRGKVDVIYIDPPYNTRANDWKYNNDYVDPGDVYAHSKWLAFMERRLKLAKRLLNPEASALIVTIDENEFLRLGLLLEQTFSEATIQMVTSVISAKGAVRRGQFSRVEENIFFVTLGNARIHQWTTNMLPSYKEDAQDEDLDNEAGSDEADSDEEEPLIPIDWLLLRRREPTSTRGARPNQFFPIFVYAGDGTLHSVGDVVEDDVLRDTVPVPKGTVALWPLKPDGTEMLWGLTPDVLRRNWAEGFARVNWKKTQQNGTVYYLPSGTIDRIRSGDITITGRALDGSVQGYITPDTSVLTPPKRVWHVKSHNAETGGTNVLSKLIPQRRFPYPKSLYAVEDTLRFIVGHKADALVVDFFGGSGTTAHAVMRLNRQDGGRRQSIIVTNNEVSADEQAALRSSGLRPGDPDWERQGICYYITKPRLQAAVLGTTPAGKPISGKNSRYRFTDQFPMSEGFEENVEFFDLTYENPAHVELDMAFNRVAPLLWMRAGCEGRRIAMQADTFDIADTYAVLFDVDAAADFLKAVSKAIGLRVVYIVTDDEPQFQAIASQFPADVESVRLYETYLRTFEINTGKE
jgi:adenine-specific DNA-methyltransferase